MRNLSNVCSWIPGIQPQKGFVCLLDSSRTLSIWAIFMGVLGLQIALGQSCPVNWTDLDSFQVGYQICSTNDTLHADEQFSVKLHLKTAGSQECLGAQFDLGWDSRITLDPASEHLVPDQSWLGIPSELSVTLLEDQSGIAAQWTLAREDSAFQSGNGWVIKVNFVVGDEPILTNEVIVALDGGLIVEENLDMKHFLPSPEINESSLAVYPNPCQDRLKFYNSPPEQVEIFLYDLSGNLLLRSLMVSNEELNLSGFHPGAYFLTVLKDQTTLKRVKIIKR